MNKALAAAALLAASAAPAFAQDTVRIATEGAYAPWNYTNANGELAGFEVDLANDLCERMGVECEIIQQAWDGIIPALQAGRYDAIMAGMSITPERDEIIDFTRSYATTPGIFVMSQDSDRIAAAQGVSQEKVNLDEVSEGEQDLIDQMAGVLDGATVGVQTATIHEAFLNEYMADRVSVSSYDTQENMELDLEAGRIDAALADQSAWGPLLESERGANYARVGPGFSGGIFGAGVGVGLREEDDELEQKFNDAIQAALEDGTVAELATEHFGFDSSATP